NDDFFTLNGGRTWQDDPQQNDGDAGPYFSDPLRLRVLYGGREDQWTIYESSSQVGYPDPSNSAHVKARIPLPVEIKDASGNILAPGSSSLLGEGYLKGYNPIVLTTAAEVNAVPLEDGDYVLIRARADGTRVLLRTTKPTQITAAADWVTVARTDGPN